MMKTLLTFGKFSAFCLLLLSLLAAPTLHAQPAEPAAALTAQTTAFFQQYVNKEGKVNYAAIQRDPDQLDALLFSIADFDAAHATAADQYAFYLNA